MSLLNSNCDGDRCRLGADRTVKVYPLGAGGNLILCSACFAHENSARFERRQEYCRAQPGNPTDSSEAQTRWPHVAWRSAKTYECVP